MTLIIGVLLVFVAVFGGYSIGGGELRILFQPSEIVEIVGAAIGSFVIGNPPKLTREFGKSLGILIQGTRHSKISYTEVLSCMYSLFKLAKVKGDLALESHVENPQESVLFQRFPRVTNDKHTLEFLCDYLRLLTLGTNNPHEVEAIIDSEIESYHEEISLISNAILTVADGLPALGIVAAVLGVIHTMGSITEPPEVLGHLIGGALVGTFTGVLLSYGFVAPIGRNLGLIYKTESDFLNCIKSCLLAHMMGYAPQISVEFGRKTLPPEMRPTFAKLEENILNLPPD